MSSSYRNSDRVPPIMRGSPPPPEWRIPFADWDRPPWNRWAFHNVRKIVPTAEVWRGAGPVDPIARADTDVAGIPFTAPTGREMTVGEMLDETYTDGFVLILDGEIIYEGYWNGMNSRSLHLSQSVAKSVTSLTAGVLIGEKLLDPAQLMTHYLPELAVTGWNGATLQQVLDMTSGTRFSEAYTEVTSDIGRMDVACGWKPAPPGEWPPGTWPGCVWDQVLTMAAVDAPHGTRFEYRSVETDVLAHAMERVTGQRLPEIVSTRLWQKIGAEESACFTVDPAGYALACGGFNACLRDYARLGLLLVNGGKVAGEQVVPEFWIDDIFSGPHGLFNEMGRYNHPNGQYRNQFWIEDRDRQTVLAKGVFGQMIMADRDSGLVAAKLSSWPDFLNPEFDQMTRAGIRAIQAALA